jgi:cytochrome bd-type quinol oxidase subunit 1
MDIDELKRENDNLKAKNECLSYWANRHMIASGLIAFSGIAFWVLLNRVISEKESDDMQMTLVIVIVLSWTALVVSALNILGRKEDK